jgi:transketolase
MLAQAWHAARHLRERGEGALRVVNLPWLNVVDDDWLAETLIGVTQVVTLDDHYVDGGQGQMLAARIARLGLAQPPAVRCLGVREIPVCGQNDEVLRAHRLDAASLTEDLAAVLATGPAA